MDTRAFENSLQAIAFQHGTKLISNANAMQGMRHQRVIRDATTVQTPEEAWEHMRVQGATHGVSLEFAVHENLMEYRTTLYWKFCKM